MVARLPDVYALNESERRAELRAPIEIRRREGEVPSGTREAGEILGPVQTRSVRLSIEAGDCLAGKDPRLTQFQARVDGQHVVEARFNVAGRRQHAERRFSADLALDAKSADDGAAPGGRIRWGLLARSAVVGNQAADRPGTSLPGQTAGELRVSDVA